MVSMMSVRSKPFQRRRSVGSRLLMWAALAVVVLAGVLGFYSYSGWPGIFDSEIAVIETGQNRVIKVPPGASIQAALSRAVGGDIIELQAGAVYRESIRLPKIQGSEFITIRTSAKDVQLPAGDTRLDPKKHASALPKIISTVRGEPAILAVNGAHHYRFLGVEFGPTVEGLYNIIQLGTGEERSVEELPHHIEFDRVYVHGSPTEGQRRGIAANGRHIKIVNSYFSDLKREGEESQAIAVWAADGPIEIVNNYLEAAAESILFGGATSDLGLIPGNAIIRHNWLNKPLEWRDTKWVVKNHLEIKSGQNIKIEYNLMTNNWVMAQEGNALIFRSADDSGKASYSRNIEFSNNIVRGASSAITIEGGEAGGGKNLTIRNNIFEDISHKKWGGRGYFLKPSTWDGLVVENNTVIHDGSITIAYGDPIKGLVFRNNIVFNNAYGFFGDGLGVGKPVIARYFPGADISYNVIVGGKLSDYGGSNYYPSSADQIGFTAVGRSDYRLGPNSPYLRNGTSAAQIGANLDPATVGGK